GGIFGFRGQSEEKTLSQNSSTLRISWKRHLIKILCRGSYSVDARQFRTDVAVVRREQLHEVVVVPYKIGDEGARFGRHGVDRFTSEVREFAAILAGSCEAVKTQPLTHIFIERFMSAGIGKHAAHLLFDALTSREFTTLGCGEKLGVGHGVPNGV